MRALFLFVALLSPAAAQVPAATPTAPPAGFTQVLRLWPGKAPLQTGTTDADTPRLYTYPASGSGPHPAVIVMPGGGYNHLVVDKEGSVEARWLNARGITAYVLIYRLSPAYHFPAPLLDGARALRYVRANASTLGVDPTRIGVWGFSAGGHLAGYLSTIHDAGDPAAGDPVDRVSSRPDFAILSYARLSMDPTIPRTGNMEALLGDRPTQEQIDSIDAVKHVTTDSSPAFIYSTGGDKSVDPLNATLYWTTLRKAGVPAELHLFERGPHGTGMAQNLNPDIPELHIWPELLAGWMRQNHWMEPTAAVADSR